VRMAQAAALLVLVGDGEDLEGAAEVRDFDTIEEKHADGLGGKVLPFIGGPCGNSWLSGAFHIPIAKLSLERSGQPCGIPDNCAIMIYQHSQTPANGNDPWIQAQCLSPPLWMS